MKPDRRVRKYAEALLTVSKDLDCIPKTGQSLLLIEQLINQEKEFRAFFYTQSINPVEKVNILKNVLGDKINLVVYEFFALLAEQSEYQIFVSVAAVYGKMQKELLNLIDVTAYSVDKINEETITSIIKDIEKVTDKKVDLSTQTDKKLLGGLKLRVGNTIFDGTIANQLTKMKKVLLRKY